MGYGDDITILNISCSTMYGSSNLERIHTQCNYLGVMQGTVYCSGNLENRPFVYFTPRNILTGNGWNSPPGCSRTNFYIECTGDRADRLFAAFGAVHSPKIYIVEDVALYVNKLKELEKFFTIGTPVAKIQQALCVEEFAALLETEIHARRSTSICRYGIDQVLKEINRKPGAVYCWHAIAEDSGITLRHWNRLFSAYTGMPPGEYQAECRLKLARHLLRSSDLSIKEIAEQCGFEYSSDFIRFFKKHTKMTPHRFRCIRLL